MRTDDLVAALAADAAPVDPARADRLFLRKLAAGVLLAVIATLVWLGPRPDLAAATTLGMFWVKLALPAAVAIGACLWAYRLAHPGARTGHARAIALLPLLAISTAGVLVLAFAPPVQRLGLLLGDTWRECLLNIPLLSLPAFVLAFWGLRGLAPTRLSAAGAAAGLFAGAAGGFGYALHCPELAAPFLGAWYVLGMLIPAGIGALAGRWALRW